MKVFEQDRDSAVGAGTPNDYEISYVVEKATTGRNAIRRSEITLPDGMQVRFKYLSTGSLHDDDDASRVTRVQGFTGGSVNVARPQTSS